MTDQNQTQLIHSENWKGIYVLGGIATILVLAGVVLDIALGSVSGGDLAALPQTAVERFSQLQSGWFMGLYNLDLLNTINQIFMIPVYFALYAAHRNINKPFAALALIIFLVGTVIFITGNTSLTMLDLSHKYSAAATESQKMLIAAAGEAMLAKGSHGSYSVFIGFVLPNIAGLIISIVMLTGKVFNRTGSWFGIAGSIIILAYLVLVTFVPSVKGMATAFAAPGGLLLMAWMIFFTIKLFKLGSLKT